MKRAVLSLPRHVLRVARGVCKGYTVVRGITFIKHIKVNLKLSQSSLESELKRIREPEEN